MQLEKWTFKDDIKQIRLVFGPKNITATNDSWILERKVCGCYSVVFLNQTPIFDWYTVMWGSKNKHYKGTCLKEIGLHLQFILTTPHSIVHAIKSAYAFSSKSKKHALPIIGIIKSRDIRFSLMLHCRFAKHHLNCVNLIYRTCTENMKNKLNNTHIP